MKIVENMGRIEKEQVKEYFEKFLEMLVPLRRRFNAAFDKIDKYQKGEKE